MSAVIFLSGSTVGDALGGIGRSFRAVFEELGLTFVEINFAQPDASEQLNRVLRETSVELAFSFMGMCSDIKGTTPDGREVNLWDGLQIPYISFYGDTPAYYFDRHVMPSDRFASVYAFPEHCRFRKRLPSIRGTLGVAPPSALDIVSKDSVDFAIKERGKLLFLKNGNDPEKLVAQWREGLPSSSFLMLADLASELANDLDGNGGNDIDATVVAYLLTKGYDVEAQRKLRLFFVAQLDDYLRRVKCTLMATSLLPFPVVIQGHNWEHIDFSSGRAEHRSGGDYARSEDDIRRSLGIIDMSPNTGEGPHERPLRAFGSYSLCLTNEQPFFREHLPQHHAFSFSFNRESLQAKVADVLAHPRRYVEVGIESAEVFRREFPTHRFGEFVLELAGLLRLAGGARPGPLQPFFAWPPTKLDF
jgi:hypothetical protein